jgi:nucleoid-associated protein YgaU
MGGGAVIAAATLLAVYVTPLQDRRAPLAEMPAVVPVPNDDVATDSSVTDSPTADSAGDPTATAQSEQGDSQDTQPDTVSVETVDTKPDTDADTDAATDTGADDDADVEAVSEPVIATQTRPRVTERRFEPDGAYLIYGTAGPDGQVAVVVDGTEVERTQTDESGTFLVTGFLGYSDTPRRMDVISDPDGAALQADRTYIIDANPEPVVTAALEPAAAPQAPGTATPSQPDVGTGQTEQDAEPVTDMAEADNTETEAIEAKSIETAAAEVSVAAAQPESPVSPTVLAITQDGVDVVEPAIGRDTSPEVMSSVALDTITYDPEGDVILGGRAQGEGFVQVYVDNKPVSRLPIDADGSWRGDLPDVDKGVYTLRIDEVDTGGDVVSRIETPFQREDPQEVIAVMADDVQAAGFTVATRTVQPGATLWAIAEERYGAGVLYVNVFEANKDRIRDPDLIYPGQVFVIPADVPTPAADN